MGEDKMNAHARRVYAERQWARPQWPPFQVSTSELSPAASEPVGYQRAEVSIPSTATEPRWIAPTAARLAELAALKHNWDRRHSAEVSRDALVFAVVILSQVMSETSVTPSIVPLGRGTLQLLWHNNAAELEVEVIRPNEVVAYFLDKTTGHEEEVPLTSDFSRITDFLSAHFRTLAI
jgi:hypothetical protein